MCCTLLTSVSLKATSGKPLVISLHPGLKEKVTSAYLRDDSMTTMITSTKDDIRYKETLKRMTLTTVTAYFRYLLSYILTSLSQKFQHLQPGGHKNPGNSSISESWKFKHCTLAVHKKPGNSSMVLHQNPENPRIFSLVARQTSQENANLLVWHTGIVYVTISVPMVKAPCWALVPPDQIGKEALAYSKFLGQKSFTINSGKILNMHYLFSSVANGLSTVAASTKAKT